MMGIIYTFGPGPCGYATTVLFRTKVGLTTLVGVVVSAVLIERSSASIASLFSKRRRRPQERRYVRPATERPETTIHQGNEPSAARSGSGEVTVC
jgi:hypothetical protein